MMHFCEKCNIAISKDDLLSHEQGKRHQKSVAFHNRKEASIFVANLPPGVKAEKIATYFGQYGDVEQCRLQNHCALVTFKNKETVKNVLTKTLFMGRYKLYVQRQRWNNTAANNKNSTRMQLEIDKLARETCFVELKLRLMEENSFESELVTFLQTVQPNNEEIEQDWLSIRSSLHATLKPCFPLCEVHRFGSSITGLSFKGSDIDIYLDIGEDIHEEEGTARWTMGTIFKEVKSSLYRKRRNVFRKIVPIPSANVPLIKFQHIPTSRNCDIVFKTGLGVINSQLIKQLLDVDPRLKPLMIIIKYWAKNFELSESPKFTNYAIVMMILFYVQQPEVKLLPPLSELMKNCEPVYKWNWQVNFNRNATFPPSNNKSDLIELLRGFFEFYANFPFTDMVISTLDGCAQPRADFARRCTETGCDGFSVNQTVCIQDPIELDRNLTHRVPIKLLETFQNFCAVGAKVSTTALENKDKPFLLNLFTMVPVSIKKQNSIHFIISRPRQHFDILMASLPENTDVKDKEKLAEEKWYSLVQDLIEDALQRVFKLDIHKLQDDHETKQQKVTEKSNVHSENEKQTIFLCTSSYRIVNDRDPESFSIDPSLSPIEKEAFISDELVNKQKMQNLQLPKIGFKFTIAKRKRPIRFLLRMYNDGSEKDSYKTLGQFIQMKLPDIIYRQFIYLVQYGGLVPAVTTERKPT